MVWKVHTAAMKSMCGVTWLENKIYTNCYSSTKVHTFQDHEPFNEETPIEIKDIQQSYDMASSKKDRAIFICGTDDNNRCVWRIQMPNKIIRRYKINGLPWRLSVTPSDDLLVLVIRQDLLYLNIYRSSDVKQLQSTLMPTEIKKMYHAVQTTNGNFVVACDDQNFPDRFMVREISKDGTQFLRN